MYQAGLVLEGGGMRGMFTCGVLDFFMEKGIVFQNCYGVSAGACHMCSYLSGQKRRAYHVAVDYLQCRDYCSARSLLLTGNLFHTDFCYELIPKWLNPYDFEAFQRYPGKAYAVVTNIASGRPEYLRLRDMEKDITAIRASSSLPLVSRNVKIGKKRYLDGAISDAIPVRKAVLDGNRKNVVILTREKGYKKEQSKALGWIRLAYLRYPKVYEMMKNRHISYNHTLDYLEEQEQKGTAFVFRPNGTVKIERIEKDKEKLTALYREGWLAAEANYEALLAWLSGGGPDRWAKKR